MYLPTAKYKPYLDSDLIKINERDNWGLIRYLVI